MAAESPRHREIRHAVRKELEGRSWTVRSAHEGKEPALYHLTDARTKSRATWLKKPDLLAKKEDKLLIVEVELRHQPVKILGDVAVVACATHYSLSRKDLIVMPQCYVIVLGDSQKWPEGSSKREQFEVLQEAYVPSGSVIGFGACTEADFGQCLTSLLQAEP